ncbi:MULTISPECIES: amino acid ABC transporter permease [Paenibacillus]|jgi:arginine/lysine/histidine transport system permease protein|uniref:amino acid ABC transporter permease n=1 Tax=Paenibacillus TaxID=44249 RepID=UPI0004F5ED9B|nr:MULTISPECIES: amino acid ABC transporter permease [unclassified Paenibacillus]AIQ30253.1 arginine ABC transporter permease [Paenibacillus sp. FSL P4-0081]OMF31112.1 arginine ABC transporter permease [Paenibacillus sp. FSL H8-0259]
MNIFDMAYEYRNFFLSGLKYTLLLAVLGVFFGFILGILVSLLRMSKWRILRFIATTWVEFLRGTPMLVQLFLIHYGLTELGLEFTPIQSGAITLTINSSAYLAEIFRAGIQGVDRGQVEAARSLGMKQGMTMRYIVLPQAIKNVLPAIGNEFITIIKESSIVSMIGVADLFFQAKTITTITYEGLTPYVVIALMYFVLTFTLSKLLGILERRLNTDDRG